MADRSEITATRMLALSPMQSAMLMIAAFGIDDYLFGAIGAGAVGSVSKTNTPNIHATALALRTAASGNGMLSPEVTPHVLGAGLATPQRLLLPGVLASGWNAIGLTENARVAAGMPHVARRFGRLEKV